MYISCKVKILLLIKKGTNDENVRKRQKNVKNENRQDLISSTCVGILVKS